MMQPAGLCGLCLESWAEQQNSRTLVRCLSAGTRNGFKRWPVLSATSKGCSKGLHKSEEAEFAYFSHC